MSRHPSDGHDPFVVSPTQLCSALRSFHLKVLHSSHIIFIIICLSWCLSPSPPAFLPHFKKQNQHFPLGFQVFHYHSHYRKFILLQGIHVSPQNFSVSCSLIAEEGERCISPSSGTPELWIHHLSQHTDQAGHQYYHYRHMKSKNLFRSTTGFHEVMLGLRGFFFFFATTAGQGKTDATHRGEITDTNFWDCQREFTAFSIIQPRIPPFSTGDF